MKIYVGMPKPEGSDKRAVPLVTVVDGAETKVILPAPGGNFSWGKDAKRSGLVYHGNLALAILTDYLGSDEAARPVYMRFAMRRFLNISPDAPFRLSEEDVQRTIEQIAETAEGMDQIQDAVSREKPRIKIEGSPGLGASPPSEIEIK